MLISWLDEVEELQSDTLTVDIQSRTDLNVDDKLMYPTLMPRRNVDSTEISNLEQVTFRPASDRRTWDQRGRQITLRTPTTRDFQIEPIEAYFTIGEFEMQRLRERFRGNRQLIVDEIRGEVAPRTRDLAAANYRRIELECFEAWINGVVTVRDPQTGEAVPVSYDFDASRYDNAGTAWTASTAYNEFIAWYSDAPGMIGACAGVALRQPVLRAILASAPNLAGGVQMSLANLSDRISQDVQAPFRFYNMDVLPDIDVYTDGGVTTVPTKRWPSVGKIAAVPVDQRIGYTAFAPVGRAMDMGIAVPDAHIDINGMAAFPETSNNGRTLTVEVQGNPLSVPNEKRIDVMDTGILG